MGSHEEKSEVKGLFKWTVIVCQATVSNQFIRKDPAHGWITKMCAKNNLSENRLQTTEGFKAKMVIQDNSTCRTTDLGFGFIFSSSFPTESVHGC